MSTDDEVRALERALASDPGAASRLAFGYARAGRGVEAVDAALRACARDPDDPARRLIPRSWPGFAGDGRSGGCAPWSGLRAPTRVRAIPGHEGTTRGRLLDAGRGVVLRVDESAMSAFDVVRGAATWRMAGGPCLSGPAGIVASDGERLTLVDPVTGEEGPCPWRDRELAEELGSLLVAVDDALWASAGEVLVLFDPSSGEVRVRVPLGEEALTLLGDPTGVVVGLEEGVRSYDRSGRLRWETRGEARPIGLVDDRCLLAGVGGTVVLSAETGQQEGTLEASTFDPLLVTRDAIVVASYAIVGVTLTAFDRATLARLWSRPPSGGHAATATADALLVQTYSDDVRSLDPRTGEEFGAVKTPGAVEGLVLTAGKLVLLPTHASGILLVD